MVDFLSLQRLRPSGYSAPEVRSPRKAVIQGKHDCRADAVKERQPSKNHIEAALSVSQVPGDILKFHEKTVFIGSANGEPRVKIGYDNKLIYSRGGTGKKPGELFYPRGLAVDQHGDIYVADTGNKRIQVFGSPGLLKEVYERDANDKRFEMPVSVAVSRAGRVAVADAKRNCICSTQWERSRTINLQLHVRPVCVQFSDETHLVVGCADGTLRTFDTDRRVEVSCLQVLDPKTNGGVGVMSIAVDTADGTIYVSDGIHSQIAAFDPSGCLVRFFDVSQPNSQLSCTPSCISISSSNTLIVTDALNHVVYSFRLSDGEFERTLLRPTDDLGAVQSVCETPEGHLAALEFTSNGPHGLKIFRYLKCACHNPSEEDTDKSDKDT